jgi:hypothetical protein
MARRGLAFTVAMVVSLCASGAGHAAGAFAVGVGAQGSWGGGTTNAANYAEATRRALLKCSEHGPGCMIVSTFTNTCFSIATQVGTSGYAWATRPTLADAKESAVRRCKSFGRRCQIRSAICDRLAGSMNQLREQPTVTPRSSTSVQPSVTENRVLGSHWPVYGLAVFLAIAIVIVAIGSIYSRDAARSSFIEKLSQADTAEKHDNDAARFWALKRKLDAESEYINAEIATARTRAELEELSELLNHDRSKRSFQH